MKILNISITLIAILFPFMVKGNTDQNTTTVDGYPIANFALTLNASANGDFIGNILRNPGKLGEWLEDMGGVEFSIKKNNESHPFSSFSKTNVERSFPFVKGEYSNSPLISSSIKTTLFCPIAINDLTTSALPVAMIEMEIKGGKKTEDFTIQISPNKMIGFIPIKTNLFEGMNNNDCMITSDASSSSSGNTLDLNVSIKPGNTKYIKILITFFDKNWITANDYDSNKAITTHVYKIWNDLHIKTNNFSKAIPSTNDKELDSYLRWYMIPGISLTKCTKNNEIVNMGYCELNQRDSYWTSWLHLVLFKDTERKIIEESINAVKASGKMPTTILPLIEREDDLDINAFLILRTSRYHKLYHNTSDLKKWWPSLKNVMDWLISRDKNGNGLPMQVSFWGDWKDVKGVEDRLYSPFSGLIYLAALKEMQTMAKNCNDDVALTKYYNAYKKGYDFINKSTQEGGLWNGRYYCQIWKDGSVNDKILQDQTIGIMFDVVPEDRSHSIIKTLNSNNLTQFGICETFPYYPEKFGYEPGTYHNGGVWPWVSFMDDWARLKLGYKDEAINLIKIVAEADLVKSGDWSPNEHINSRTGKNLGFKLQGWNSGLFGLIYFGLLNPDIIN